MNKQDFIKAIAAKADITQKDAGVYFEAMSEVVFESLKQNDKIALVGFGTFGVSGRAARVGRNPQTGEEVQIAARNAVSFKAGAGLKDAVN